MGLFFKKKHENDNNVDNIIDKSEDAYNSWLNFIAHGGTTEEWGKSTKHVSFKPNEYIWNDNKYKSVSGKYFAELEKIESEWSVLYNLNDYTGERADKFIAMCQNSISLFKQLVEIQNKYGEDPAHNVPAYKRLAMFYEKNERYEDAVSVCVDALENEATGDKMSARLIRMIKKAGRVPTSEELELIDTVSQE